MTLIFSKRQKPYFEVFHVFLSCVLCFSFPSLLCCWSSSKTLSSSFLQTDLVISFPEVEKGKESYRGPPDLAVRSPL